MTSDSFWILLLGACEIVRDVQALADFFVCLSVNNGFIVSFLVSFSLGRRGVMIDE